MAKMFYSLEEAAQRLDKTEREVQDMVVTGQLQEFRDRDRLMFKREQVDLLAGDEGGEAGESEIPLADSGDLGTISLASDSGSGMNLDSPKEQTGISIFEPEETDEGDPSAVTHITEVSPDVMLETAGSGSGLLDLTREGDDTSLGADLLEDIYSDEGDESVGASTTMSDDAGDDAGALFESTEAESDVSVGSGGGLAPAGGVAFAEPYDGGGSGLAGGLALGMIATVVVTMMLVLGGMVTQQGSPLVPMVASQFFIWVGGLAGATFLLGLIGWALGRRG